MTLERKNFKVDKQEKVLHWENYPLEKLPKKLNDWFETKVIPVFQYYRKYPWMIKMNLKHFIAENGYYLACYIDPSPPSGFIICLL